MFSVLCTTTLDVYRVGGVVGGWQQPPALVYSGIPCVEPFPVDPILRFYTPVEEGQRLIQTIFSGDYAIVPNDMAEIDGTRRTIKELESWYLRPTNAVYILITMED